MKPNFKTVEFTLSANVADDGTFTVAYPTGYDDGDFENAAGHYAVLNGARLTQPDDLGLSFGTSELTVTNRTGSTLIAGKGYFTFVFEGKAASLVADVELAGGLKTRKQVNARVVDALFIDFGSPATADADGILNDESATDSATSYTSTDFVSTFDGTLDVPRNLTATGTAGSNHVITVTGEDEYGQPMQESLTLSGTNVIAGVKAFKKVTAVAVAAGAASDTFDLGWGDVLGLPVRVTGQDVIAEHEGGTRIGTIREDVYIPFEVDATKYAAGTSEFVISPIDGTIEEVVTTVVTATTGAGAIGIELATVPVTGLSVVIATGASVGDLDSDTPTTPGSATTLVTQGAAIEITGDGTPSAGAIRGFIRVRPTGVMNGTLVDGLALNTEQTLTTADPRGTYDPDTACDGTTSFGLTVLLPEGYNIGNKHFSA